MTTRVVADCPTCGRVDLAPVSIRLVLCARPIYAWTCPHCDSRVVKDATEQCIGLLRVAGVLPVDVEAEVVKFRASLERGDRESA